jgi:8-oxo-dGTP pyrophosphatase MutT (NUDIX family)
MDLDAMEIRLRRVEEELGLRQGQMAPHAMPGSRDARQPDHATMHFKGVGRTAPAVEPLPLERDHPSWDDRQGYDFARRHDFSGPKSYEPGHDPMSDKAALARAHGFNKALAKVNAPKAKTLFG